ncbi:hypothetical protein CEUSTIGMA_g1095.t1 [Chlamydomonas eustigma]|uniref:Leucine aminopeptidase n=1 Tax=Chlamydomonas eustigma TaxID=1157962 RepID=A0A250WS19_9CHLO|nr:hypothetical protein CEUSTIGMA_g1095.t1 [Chlamydomonas eustigma]|eukprot:GAX73644.1 hypothetical protein CEUSTIGMA_g1095.t1 [Chlamydomonas eustigma]
MADPSSHSNFNLISVTSTHFELDVNFDRKVIEGFALLQAKVSNDSSTSPPSHLILDTRDLSIHKVDLVQSGGAPATQSLKFTLGETHNVLGSPLLVELPAGLTAGQEVTVGVRFSTSPTSSAVQYLAPEQTAGGKHPYLFTQCQAIHARSLVPCQDSPGAKMSYSAVVRVPEALTALMSAVPLEDDSADVPHLSDVSSSGPTRLFSFQQKVPIPPYLIALAVGELESRELSSRSRVWSEPSMVEAGAYEFAETAKFLDAGEMIAGEYVWGRYDLLLLPPSFPYGGMENPCMTFVTPTLLAGDRSLTNVVAHEIAHSWTGNLVTNATWEHFWLNEGFTVYLERSILGQLHGPKTFQFHAANGALLLADDVKRMGAHHPYTKLVPSLENGVDPDDVFSKVPYEKGFWFLYFLQELVGGTSVFHPFLRAYLNKFKFSTVTSEGFRNFFNDYFKDVAAAAKVDWETWYFAPGMPPVSNVYDTSLAEEAFELAKKWHTCDVMGIGSVDRPAGCTASDVAGWTSEQMVTFLEKLMEYRSLMPLHAKVAQGMDEVYNMSAYRNCEIRAAWYKLAISAEETSVLPQVSELLKTQGRMKYLRPLFRALFRSKMGKDLALQTFSEARASYHPIAQKMVAADLGL